MTTQTAGEVATEDYKLVVTITQTADENLYLVDGSGNQNVYVNGGVFANSKSGITSIGAFTIDCAWYEDDGVTAVVDAQVLASLHGDYDFQLEGKGNIQLLKDNSSAETENVATSLDVSVTMDASGDCTVNYIRNHGAESGSATSGYFAVRPNHTNGAEYVAGDFTAYTSGAKAADSLISYDGGYWKVNTALTTEFVEGNCTRIYLHSEDKIAVK